VLGPGVDGGWAPLGEIDAAVGKTPPAKTGFIFHIGHCGSTLISRLVEEAGSVCALREPLALRQFALLDADLPEGLSLWDEATLRRRMDVYFRTASCGEMTIIKATSWCGALSARVPGPAVFCYVKPEAYVASMLGGANNPVDLRLHAPLRLKRLRRLCSAPVADLAALSPGEMAAMSWAAETATLAPSPVLALDFDDFLQRQEELLGALLTQFALPSSPQKIRTTLSGPLMRTYSKDASFNYSPQDRREIIAEHATNNAAEISRARTWLDAAALLHPSINAALARFGG
jgi:hypothetical protein